MINLRSICKMSEAISILNKISQLLKKIFFLHYRNITTSWMGSAHWEHISFYTWSWIGSMQVEKKTQANKQKQKNHTTFGKGQVQERKSLQLFLPWSKWKSSANGCVGLHLNTTSKGCPTKLIPSKECHLPLPGQSVRKSSPYPAFPKIELTCNPQITGMN